MLWLQCKAHSLFVVVWRQLVAGWPKMISLSVVNGNVELNLDLIIWLYYLEQKTHFFRSTGYTQKFRWTLGQVDSRSECYRRSLPFSLYA